MKLDYWLRAYSSSWMSVVVRDRLFCSVMQVLNYRVHLMCLWGRSTYMYAHTFFAVMREKGKSQCMRAQVVLSWDWSTKFEHRVIYTNTIAKADTRTWCCYIHYLQVSSARNIHFWKCGTIAGNCASRRGSKWWRLDATRLRRVNCPGASAFKYRVAPTKSQKHSNIESHDPIAFRRWMI